VWHSSLDFPSIAACCQMLAWPDSGTDLKNSEPSAWPRCYQSCQMVYFLTKNPNLGKFWRTLGWKMLICFMAIWNILLAFGIFYDQFGTFCVNLVHFFRFQYHSPRKIWQPWLLHSQQRWIQCDQIGWIFSLRSCLIIAAVHRLKNFGLLSQGK
jgi:hypothetical protein